MGIRAGTPAGVRVRTRVGIRVGVRVGPREGRAATERAVADGACACMQMRSWPWRGVCVCMAGACGGVGGVRELTRACGVPALGVLVECPTPQLAVPTRLTQNEFSQKRLGVFP